MRYCPDSWGVLAWMERVEPAASRVEDVLAAGRPVMSWINLGEVFYQVYRRRSPQEAHQVVRLLRPSLDLELPTEARVLEAATIKASHGLAYADAFAVATAAANGAVLLTGDPEILTAGGEWPVEDLRPGRDLQGTPRGQLHPPTGGRSQQTVEPLPRAAGGPTIPQKDY